MSKLKDEKWLKKVFRDCFDNTYGNAPNDKKLENFSMLIRNMVKNIDKELDETRALWEREPTSKALRKKFVLLEKCLLYLERYCRGKIERENIN